MAILTLTLGIGAKAAVFSVTNADMLRYLRVPDPQQLVSLNYRDQPENTPDRLRGVTLLATAIPARRLLQLNPIVALRYE